MRPRPRNICFVTGTRAEFGLMRTVLESIRNHPKLRLQLIVTGMHLHAEHGRSIDVIRREEWQIHATVPWVLNRHDPSSPARSTGRAIASLADAYKRLQTDIVIVVGDRVEAFAAATAGHLSQRIVAHIHGGDRAIGQVDDSLRHAITKLAHVHFPATATSAARLLRLGEDRSRIHRVGSPGIDGIANVTVSSRDMLKAFPKLTPHRFALIVFHPVDSRGAVEFRRARNIFAAVRAAGIEQTVVVYPNNDPGAHQIIHCWQHHRTKITYLVKDIPRPMFLGLLRDSAMLIGNSSSGIIEAASFGTPVIDIGPRQEGRERSENVTNVPYESARIIAAVKRLWNRGRPRRWGGKNVYGGDGTGGRIASCLANLRINDRLRRKLIAY